MKYRIFEPLNKDGLIISPNFITEAAEIFISSLFVTLTNVFMRYFC